MASKPRTWRRRILTWTIIVIGVGFAGYFTNGGLFARVQFVALDEYPKGLGASSAGMRQDNFLLLSEYSPQSLVGQLRMQNPAGRAVVCTVLSHSEYYDQPRDLRGVAPALARTGCADQNPVVRELACNALYFIPSIPAADTDGVVECLRTFPSDETTARILDGLVRSGDDKRSICEYLIDRTLHAEGPEQQAAFCHLARSFADDPEGATVVYAMASDIGGASERTVRALAEWARSRPDDYLRLLSESRVSRLVAIRVMAASLPDRRMRMQPPGLDPFSIRYLAEDDELVDKVEALAVEMLANAAEAELPPVISLLAESANGCNALVETAVRTSSPKTRSQLLRPLARILNNGYLQEGRLCYTSDAASALVGLMLDPDADVRKAAIDAVNQGISPPHSKPKPFPAEGGIHAATAIDQFRRLLDEFPGEGDTLALHYFELIRPFESQDVPRVAAAIRRDLQTWQATQAFFVLRQRFPSSEETLALMKEHPELVSRSERFFSLPRAETIDLARPASK